MTKFNIRTLILGYLQMKDGDRFLDIGAGTGSISIEASLHGAKVWAVEVEQEGVELIKSNAAKFKTPIHLIHGKAPEALPKIKFNKCFVGGSKGQLEGIFEYLEEFLEEEGIVCGNFITLNNLNQFISLLKKYTYKDIEVQLIQTSEMDEIGLLKGQNPIFIVKGVR